MARRSRCPKVSEALKDGKIELEDESTIGCMAAANIISNYSTVIYPGKSEITCLHRRFRPQIAATLSIPSSRLWDMA